MKKFINTYVIPPIAYLLIRVFSITLKLYEEGTEHERKLLGEGKGAALVFWHGRLFYLAHYYLNATGRFKTLVSPSADGEIIARLLAMFGYGVVRGSSFKNAAGALLTLTRCVKNGYWPALIGDGSRGPLHKLQPGGVMISKLSGRPALPVTVSFSRYWTLPSWDRMMIPKPFSKAVVIFGEPVSVPADCDSAGLEAKRKELEAALVRITQRADGYFPVGR
ncbi:MAG: lysophospholipid acyltransferase family protein [Nitrospinae bacterium]|nr:lysophospholipid acyltransferase family protein [Nitrospinota bacterium]